MKSNLRERDRVLFCSVDVFSSSASSAIRNRRLVNTLSEFFRVEILNVITTDAESGLALPDWLVAEHRLVLRHDKRGVSTGSITGHPIARYLRSLAKSLIPDKNLWGIIGAKIPDSIHDLGLFEYVVTSSDPKSMHFLFSGRVVAAAKRHGTKFVQYWGDPWYDDIGLQTGIHTKVIEGRLLRRADLVLYNSLGTLKRQSSLFRAHSDKLRYLSRGIPTPKRALPDRAVYSLDDSTLLYAGDYDERNRTISALAKAAGTMKIPLIVVGSGSKGSLGDTHAEYHGRVDEKALEAFFDRATILVVLLNRMGNQIPGKLFDYLSTDKPILVLHHDHIPEEVLRFRARLVLVRNDESSIKKWLCHSRSVEVDFRPVKENSFRKEVEGIFSVESNATLHGDSE